MDDRPRTLVEVAEPRILSLPQLLTEQEVAKALGCSVDTVRRERKRGKLGFTRIGGRVRHTDDQVRTYILNQREDPCEKEPRIDSEKSEAIGLVSGAAAKPGAEPGSIPKQDRLAAHRSAQKILTKPNSRSPRGSWLMEE
jgi:excisionase family DNA binding protein